MASVIDSEPLASLYAEVTIMLVNDQYAAFVMKIVVWQNICHINGIIPLPLHSPHPSHAFLPLSWVNVGHCNIMANTHSSETTAK
ncbi:hypothetical protein ACEUAI_13225 [Aeromonas veronii]|uniref:hypothetical protein n=1 Tax=Aeromonas hydrophila TaxID=644 RepID=UPI002B48506F|nr:hypothetical protein [Aeromonas hydrophila]